MTRKRRLTDADREIWGRVARTTRPLASGASLKVDDPEDSAPAATPPGSDTSLPAARIFRPTPPSSPPAHDLARPLGDALASAPMQMDKRRFQRMLRGKLVPEARIDLHGMTLAQAHGALNSFILRAQQQGLRLVLVITGKGRNTDNDGPIPRRPGALKQDVPRWLRMAPLAPAVLEIREAHARHGGAGAYYVYLRRNR